jgi:large subunit ribosomal protein L30
MSVAGSLRITYVRSGIGHPRDQKETVRALGLRRLRQSVVRPDSPQLRGMVFKVRHLVTVTEEAGEAGAAVRRGKAAKS